MSKKIGQRQKIVRESNGNGQVSGERADFTSFGEGRPSYIERGWARGQAWAAVERPDRNPAPLLTDAARAVLAEEREHANHNGN